MSLTEIFYKILDNESGDSHIMKAMEAVDQAFSQVLVPGTAEINRVGNFMNFGL